MAFSFFPVLCHFDAASEARWEETAVGIDNRAKLLSQTQKLNPVEPMVLVGAL
jgi:hypothetical protein